MEKIEQQNESGRDKNEILLSFLRSKYEGERMIIFVWVLLDREMEKKGEMGARI